MHSKIGMYEFRGTNKTIKECREFVDPRDGTTYPFPSTITPHLPLPLLIWCNPNKGINICMFIFYL